MASLVACISAIYNWLLNNSLSLNPDKSEVVIFGTHCSIQSRCDDISVSVVGAQIVASDSFKNFGIILDVHMTFNKHVGNVGKAYNYHIRALRHIHASVRTRCQNSSTCNCRQQTQLLQRPAYQNIRLIKKNCRKYKTPRTCRQRRQQARPRYASSSQTTLATDSGESYIQDWHAGVQVT